MSFRARSFSWARRGILLAALWAGSAAAVQLQVPATHPRLFYGDAARLQQARTYYGTHAFTPAADDYAGLALRGLLTGSAADCTTAAHHVRDWQASNGDGGFRDDVRGEGEDLMLEFDWCHDRLTAAEIQTLVTRWNGYMDRELADTLGNTGKEANNYWAGRTRNLLLWGIASTGENPRAQEFIDDALEQRMGVDFTRWYGDFGVGGVFPEGDDYGVVSLSYPLIAFASAADFGYDPFAQTPYYTEAIYALAYGSTPGPSTIDGEAANEASFFPFNDDEHFYEGGAINLRDYLGDFATWFGTRNPASGNAHHALAWRAATGAGRRWMFDALGTTGSVADLASMPLDYYAKGAEVFDARTSHTGDATQVHLQLGTPGGIEHRHLDGGSFQLWRKGRWMTRESTGYADALAGFMDHGTTDSTDPVAHNALLFEGRSTGIWIGSTGPLPVSPGGDQPRGLPHVVRLQHAPQFAFAAVDLSDAYRNGLDTRVDWPYAEIAIREFLFIRPLQALVVLDRMRASSDSQRPFYASGQWLEDGPHEAAAAVRRTFVMHFERAPTASGGNRMTAPAGTQTAELITLVPASPYAVASPSVRVFNEDQPGDAQAGQYRLELDSIGSAESYFLNVVTGHDDGEQPIDAQLQDEGDHWQVTLSHPGRGTATIVLAKGMQSSGGSVRIGDGETTPLAAGVQGMHVDTTGPVWDGGGDVIFAYGFEAR
ncbi:hypothetical protein FHW12_002923 [Dokdonella fugitiva]|uniref:Heparinase II/III-like protein n=1 Tax=Dokdonella fugitiva TaxID=328517 RepID=A0A839F6K1_9GAMM|nr:hypothetical protein [Dokdonella fugitiva]MBA8888690.1 hypothetical protein [Dokdonella fugitiva]